MDDVEFEFAQQIERPRNCASVSPAKPTMMSVAIVTFGIVSRISWMTRR